MSKKYKINAFGYIGLLIVWIFPIIFGVSLLRDLFEKHFNIPGLIGAFCVLNLLAIPSLLVTFSIYWQISTEITEIGFTRKLLWVSKTIRWDEIESVESTIFKMTLITKKGNEQLNLVLFKNSNKIAEAINHQLENSRKGKIGYVKKNV